MGDLMREGVVRELVGWIAQQKQTSAGMNPTRPGLKDSGLLKFVPVFRSIKDVKVRFAIAGQLRLVQFFGDDTEIEFRFDRRARRDKAPDIMINEMFALGVLPILRMQGQGNLAEGVFILLTEGGKFDLLQTAKDGELIKLGEGRTRRANPAKAGEEKATHRLLRS